MGCERIWASSNPSGIIINPGYYALAEAILTNHRIYDIMRKWCNVVDALPAALPAPEKVERKKRKYRRVAPTKTKKIIKLYHKNKKMKNKRIAEIVGCTPEMVGKVLHSIGVRRNRWDGYVSKDPRYSKEKKEEK
jgi:hypothetical protein